MNQYKLLTPGPLTTTDTVKAVMQVDHCTWDDDYKQITQRIRAQLLALGHVAEPAYTAVLMQGSGTFGVESVLTTVVGPKDKVLIAANGAYGLRMTDICRHAGVAYTLYEQPNDQRPEAGVVAKYLAEDPAITHVAMVHGETTSGILNDVAAVGQVAKAAGKTDGFVKVLADENDVIVGGCVVGEHATELLAELTLAVELQLTAEQVGRVIHPHPTMCEALGLTPPDGYEAIAE